jgi:hypothetical protein
MKATSGTKLGLASLICCIFLLIHLMQETLYHLQKGLFEKRQGE